MSQDKTTETSENEDFVLKHRIAGAAFLLIFGALVLPWLLGAPNQDTKGAVDNLVDTSSQVDPDQVEQITAKEIENDLALAIKDEELNQDVYVSKITPLDPSVSNSTSSAKTDESTKLQTSTNIVKTNAVKAKPAETKDKPEKAKVVAKSKPKVAKVEVAKAKSKEKSKEKPKEKPKPVKTKPAKAKTVEVGWLVSVGVFSNIANANAVVKDLKTKSFKPKTSKIDTNKGVATRVWLGPFEQRVEAAKVKASLKKKTGEPGLIKAYP